MCRGIGGENPGSGYGGSCGKSRCVSWRTKNTSYIWVMGRVGVGLGEVGGKKRQEESEGFG